MYNYLKIAIGDSLLISYKVLGCTNILNFYRENSFDTHFRIMC